MNNKQLKQVGRHMSKLLRHDPEDLKLDSKGYCLVDDLLNKKGITKEELDWIVDNNNKKRFAYNEDQTKIRANQGHSSKLKFSIDMKESDRIEILYHGTALKNLTSILASGLNAGSRKHVHLSKSLETAKTVAKRHSKDIVILKIDSAAMRADGIKIYISDNNVYLTEYVDKKYISLK